MAYRFVDLLEATGLTLWQVLPLGPTSFGYSPYQSPSAFAGNPLLISLELLQEEGYWQAPEFLPDFPIDQVDFPQVASWKQSQLRQSKLPATSFCRRSKRPCRLLFAGSPLAG